MDVVNSLAAPPAILNFKRSMTTGDSSHCVKYCSTVWKFSADQMDDNSGLLPLTTSPKAFAAVGFARTIVPRPSTSNAGHAALSRPKTISALTKNPDYLI